MGRAVAADLDPLGPLDRAIRRPLQDRDAAGTSQLKATVEEPFVDDREGRIGEDDRMDRLALKTTGIERNDFQAVGGLEFFAGTTHAIKSDAIAFDGDRPRSPTGKRFESHRPRSSVQIAERAGTDVFTQDGEEGFADNSWRRAGGFEPRRRLNLAPPPLASRKADSRFHLP